ncbi:MAG: orotate phosphoribosyltransferase [Fusobacteriia bacterium 4572_132]|nr:MAG: orotate phosphoribosyltransferase [Fusobacteriia bacterium 4572_132]
MDYRRKIAEKLLEIKAVALSPSEPFTWASGIKSPIYCDNRLVMSYPKVRDFVAEGLKELIINEFGEAEVLAGTSTAGIPHAAWVSQKMELPMVYVRGAAKKHGKQNQIEGLLEENKNVVVIEDLISTGGSSLEVVESLNKRNVNVLGLVAIFTYGFDISKERFNEKEVKYNTLTDYKTLIEVALEKEYITEKELKILKEWRKDPKNYYRNIGLN